MSDNEVVCWLYTYTEDTIDGIYIIIKKEQKKYVIYGEITDTEITDTSISIENIKNIIKDNNRKYEIEYNEDNLQKLINDASNN